MKLHDLKPAPGSHTPARRVGRGHGSGKGKTAGRGTRGQKSRAGASIPAWFEGGQTPLHVRTPKLHGFRNRGRVAYAAVNLGADRGRGGHRSPLTCSCTTVRPPLEVEGAAGEDPGEGDAPKGVTIHAHAFSRSALDKLAAAGSTVQRISWPDGDPIDEEAEAKAAVEAAAKASATRRPGLGRERRPRRSPRPKGEAEPAGEPGRGVPRRRGAGGGRRRGGGGRRRGRARVIQSVVTALQAPDIRRKILFTAFILLIFRILTAVPVPNVDQARLAELFATNQLLALLDIFSGGGLATASIIGLGLNPYINASIIMQLMQGVIPRLQELQREGEYGRNRLQQYTRYLTVPWPSPRGSVFRSCSRTPASFRPARSSASRRSPCSSRGRLGRFS